MRSCSSSVLVHESAEEVVPVDLGRRILATGGRFDSGIRRLQPECPVGTMGVVVLHVGPEYLLQVPAADDQQPVQALGTDRGDPAFGVALALGACTGVISTSVPSDRNTSSKARVNFASRWRMRNCNGRCSSISRFRACWVTQAPSGWAVAPARCTRRLLSSMKNSTYSRGSQTVSTVKKSQAMIPAACWPRNARQVVATCRGAGSSPCRAASCGWWWSRPGRQAVGARLGCAGRPGGGSPWPG